MMADYQMTFSGNLAADPELRFTQSGKAIANLRVAVSCSRKIGDEWDDRTAWESVTVFDRMAENVAESLHKGDRVTIVGRRAVDKWQDRESGEDRTKDTVLADEVAVSLKRATVGAVARNEKSNGGGGQSRPSQGQSRARQEHDEEPF